jgi:nicotinate-nucleotide pyrophosphorylase (carboxylating)
MDTRVQEQPGDIRDVIFAGLGGKRFTAALTPRNPGILSGVKFAGEEAQAVQVSIDWIKSEGERVEPGEVVARVSGAARPLSQAEERLLGCLCKASGVASAARQAMDLAAGRIRVVSGAWKKMPPPMKSYIRQAVASGGMPSRIMDGGFIYLDKNYVRIFGGIRSTLQAVRGLPGVKVIQVRGEEAAISEETEMACQVGAGIVMVDTGNWDDACHALQVARSFPQVQVAFAGGIQIQDIPALADLGLHILDIGIAILDAPLLDFRLDVVR